jgi:hypothetical protein
VEALVAYFRRLAEASDRIKVDELGKTTPGRPFILATISSPANLARLASSRRFSAASQIRGSLIARGRGWPAGCNRLSRN